jgi:nucleotide-binding universal stress UspA family protein
MRTEGVIVVGVDGSESARTLLEFALEEAARRSARVQAVTAFHTPVTWPGVWRMTPPSDFVPPSTEQLAEAAKPIIEQTVREVIAQGGGAEATVPVDVRVVPGHAATVLVDESAGADLLVVGHRGRGGFASMCLGSVGLQCVLHARCPVTVVRPVGTSTSQEVAAAGS